MESLFLLVLSMLAIESEVSKLELAADMVRTVMPELEYKHQVLLLFDSWYAKKALVRALKSVLLSFGYHG